MTVHRVHHQLMYFYVFIIPQATIRQWRIIRAWVNRAIAGIDDSPTAFGAHFAHGGTCVRHLLAGTDRVRRLVKRFGAVTGPIWTGSKRMSYRGFLLTSGKRLFEIRNQIIDRLDANG